jgi:hypothetical protein
MHDPETGMRLRDDLLSRIADARSELEQEIGRLSEAQLTATGPDGWSVKDHLAHLASRQQKVIAAGKGQSPHEGLQVDYATYVSASIDEVNDLLYARHRDRPLPEVMAFWRTTHDELVGLIRGMTDVDLERPYDPNDPEEYRRLIDAIAGNSYEHAAEHLGWIRELLARG